MNDLIGATQPRVAFSKQNYMAKTHQQTNKDETEMKPLHILFMAGKHEIAALKYRAAMSPHGPEGDVTTSCNTRRTFFSH